MTSDGFVRRPWSLVKIWPSVGVSPQGWVCGAQPWTSPVRFAEDSETLVDVAASTMNDMFGARFRPYLYGEM